MLILFTCDMLNIFPFGLLLSYPEKLKHVFRRMET